MIYMKKEVLTCGIAISLSILFFMILSMDISKNLQYSEKNLEPVTMGFADGEELLTIDLDYRTLYLAYGSDLNKQKTFRYHDSSLEKEDIFSPLRQFELYTKYDEKEIRFMEISEKKFIELISVQNWNSSNPYIVTYRLENKEKYDSILKENYNSIIVQDKEIIYYVHTYEWDVDRKYEICSLLKINDMQYLEIRVGYINKGTSISKSVEKILNKIYKHIRIEKKAVVETSSSSQKNSQKMSMLICSKKERNSGQTKQCNTIYHHKMQLAQNRTIATYVLETIITCPTSSLYMKEKNYYKDYSDIVFSSSKNSFTYYIGDGYDGTNGNEDTFKGKTLNEAKVLVQKFGLGSCEVQEYGNEM